MVTSWRVDSVSATHNAILAVAEVSGGKYMFINKMRIAGLYKKLATSGLDIQRCDGYPPPLFRVSVHLNGDKFLCFDIDF
jgi:hypothetical protein